MNDHDTKRAELQSQLNDYNAKLESAYNMPGSASVTDMNMWERGIAHLNVELQKMARRTEIKTRIEETQSKITRFLASDDPALRSQVPGLELGAAALNAELQKLPGEA